MSIAKLDNLIINIWRTVVKKILAKSVATACALLLSGCGGGEEDLVVQIQGKVIDGYINGAKVFWDCNGNLQIDSDEVSVTSGAGGAYAIAVSPSPKAPLTACTLRAYIPADAIDEDTGLAIGSPVLLSSSNGNNDIISPLTTLVDAGFTENEIKLKLGTTLPLNVDYIKAGVDGALNHNAAKISMEIMKSINKISDTANIGEYNKTIKNSVNNINLNSFLLDNSGKILQSSIDSERTKFPIYDFIGLDKKISPVVFALKNEFLNKFTDEQKLIINDALLLAKKYPFAINGQRINWGVIPEYDRNIIGARAASIMPNTNEIENIRNKLLIQGELTRGKIYAAQKKYDRVTQNKLIYIGIMTTAQGINNLITIHTGISAARIIKKSKGFDQIKMASRALDWKRFSKLASFDNIVACGGTVAESIDAISNPSDDVFEKWISNSQAVIDVGKCISGFFESPKIVEKVLGLSDIAAKGAKGLKDFESEEALNARFALSLLELGESILDISGFQYVSAVMDSTIGMYLRSQVNLLDFNEAADKAFAKFDLMTDNYIKSHIEATKNYGLMFFSARIDPYLTLDVSQGFFASPSIVVVGSDVVFTPNSYVYADKKYQQTYQWDFGDGTQSIINDSPVPVVHNYKESGNFFVTLTVGSFFSEDGFISSDAYSAVVEKLVEVKPATVALVKNISPVEASIGMPITVTVTGQDLPLTAVLSIADATCQTPTNRTATGFTVVCTPGGAAGSKVVTVKTDTEVNGGGVIDASKTVSVSASSSSASKIPHTGITSSQCYTAGSNALVSCPSAGAIALSGAGKQDGMYADVNAMSYSRVGTYPLTSCVKDNVTGLIWEGKEASGIRAGGNTYTNYGDGRAGDASAYVAAVNALALCGYTDWRLPTVDELQGLVDYGKPSPGPTINADVFVNRVPSIYWTSSPYAGSTWYNDSAWVVYFGAGIVAGNVSGGRSNHGAVRLVRASQ